MAATGFARLGERTVTVRELTVREVRDWMVELETRQEADAIGALALDECRLEDLARMSDISAADLEGYTPSEMEDLVVVCKALNPHFFKVRAALTSVARLIQKEAQALVSTAPAAAS